MTEVITPDILIIGGGPAGISAALTTVSRAGRTMVISNEPAGSGLYKAARIDNYPGLPGVSGPILIAAMREHALNAGVSFVTGRVTGASKTGKGFFVSAGSEVFEASAIILATGVVQKGEYPGESKLLGAGVSYCATCDGMLYRGKKVAVIGNMPGAGAEARFLAGIGCDVVFFKAGGSADEPGEGIPCIKANRFEIKGAERVCSLFADGAEYPCQGVFILRSALAPSALMPGIETLNGHIKTGSKMETSVRGVFAAGDCTGPPYQIAKAVGDGCVAALSAAEFLE